MMKNITMNLKHLVLTFTLAIFAVAANAATTVTYSLTTHDGRTITGTANLADGANLNTITNSMPQDLWRAYCTYSFYINEEKTQQITTTLPSGVTTIYVDYVFDPPFIISSDSGEPIWHNIRTWNSGGSNNYMLYLKQNAYPEYEGVFGSKCSSQTSTPTYGKNGIDPNANMGILGDCQWAFYGDAYDLNIKINDASYGTDGWLQWRSATNAGNLKLGSKPAVGWQIYLNNTQKNGGSYPTMMLGVPNSDLYVNLSNVNYAIKTTKLDSEGLYDGYLKFNEHHELETTLSSKKNNMWWYGLFATPVGSGWNLNYNVTYKILKENGTWNQPDIVKTQTNKFGTPQPLSFPAEYTRKDGCTYDYYYKDADFTDKYPDNYTMPNTQNIVVYIKEIGSNYVAEQWKTLVLPYSIDNLDDYFGTNGVRVLEYTSVQGQLNGDAFRCNLIFTPVDDDKGIEAYKPYLFKADHVSETVLNNLRHTVNNMGVPIEIKKYDTENAPNIGVSMLGVLNEEGYSMDDDGLHFFFGSYPNGDVDNYENYTYKFYRYTAIIPRFRCYFFVTDERPGGSAPIRVSFGTESITGVGSVVADIQVNNSIYTLDGRKVNATSLDNLKRGIYIVNGRKVMK